VRLLAISGSLRAASLNSAALEAMRMLAPEGVEVALWRDLGSMPPFNADLDGEPPPEAVRAFRALVGSCDGLLIAAPEYAHGVPGALKNALDWLVGSDVFPGKPTALVNVSPRAFHAQAALRETLATMSARLALKAFVALPLTGRTLDAQAILADPEWRQALRRSLAAFIAAIEGDGSQSGQIQL
jgi:chromate reductase